MSSNTALNEGKKTISKEVAQQYGVLPLEVNGPAIELGARQVLSAKVRKDLAFISGRDITVEILEADLFEAKFEEIYGTGWISNKDKRPTDEKGQQFQKGIDKQFVSGSVVQQVRKIIDRAIERGASDIHLEPYEKRFRVRFRMDGVLQTMGTLVMQQKEAIISRIKIMSNLDIAEKRRPQDGRIRLNNHERDIDIRVSTLPTEHGEKAVLRILDRGALRLELGALGFTADIQRQFEQAIQNPFGIILVTGPTGSGKTTTLYAALQQLNSEHVNITTIEDPIEYNLDGINQTHVRSDIGLTFSKALRSFLRQDPDIIMVGEIRDKETAEIAIRASLTGHLVFSTLHTNDAPSAITRLIDMGVEPFLVASSVRLVMAQRLVRKVCDGCQEEYQPEVGLLSELNLNGSSKKVAYTKGSGCEKCFNTGYRGRTALFELMAVDETLAEMISGRATLGKLRDYARTEGMQTLREAGLEKIRQKVTTVDEVVKQTAIF